MTFRKNTADPLYLEEKKDYFLRKNVKKCHKPQKIGSARVQSPNQANKTSENPNIFLPTVENVSERA